MLAEFAGLTGIKLAASVAKTVARAFAVEDTSPMQVSSKPIAKSDPAVKVELSRDGVISWVAGKYDLSAMTPAEFTKLADELLNNKTITMRQHAAMTGLLTEGMGSNAGAATNRLDMLALWDNELERAQAKNDPNADTLKNVAKLLREISELREA